MIAGSATQDGGRYDYRELINEFTAAGAHVHLYSQFRKITSTGQLNNTMDVEDAYRNLGKPGFVHLRDPIPPGRFVEEWSQYDAGLLHVPGKKDAFRSLHMPNRYSAYIAAGLPVTVAAVEMRAMRRQLEKLGAGIIYNSITELMEQLPDASATARIGAVRESVTLETVFPELMEFIAGCLP